MHVFVCVLYVTFVVVFSINYSILKVLNTGHNNLFKCLWI